VNFNPSSFSSQPYVLDYADSIRSEMSCAPPEKEEIAYAIPPAIAPAPSPIREGSSLPADPEATSFLLLPAELRNEIYHLALVLSEPLVISVGGLYRRSYRYPDRDIWLARIGDDYSKWASDCSMDHVDLIIHEDLDDYSLTRRAGPGNGLFATCRQVYSEATSVFFARNTFEISKPNKDWSYQRWRGASDAPSAYIADGADWLISLGSQLTKLSRVVVDLDALPRGRSNYTIYQSYEIANGCLDIVDLLRVLWNRHVNVQFSSARRMSLDGVGGHQDDVTSHTRITKDEAQSLGILVRSLQRDDLGIRKNARVICHVCVHRSGRRGFVVFRSTHHQPCRPQNFLSPQRDMKMGIYHPCFQHRLNFTMGSDEYILRVVPPPRQLKDLPKHIRDRILDLVLHHNGAVPVDLNKEIDNGPGWIYMNWAVYRAALPRYYTVNKFILHTRFISHEPVLVNLDSMNRWMTRLGPSHMSASEMAGLRGRNVRRICLKFILSQEQNVALDQLRINTASLILHETNLSAKAKLYVTLWRSDSMGNEELLEQTAFSLHDLRVAVVRAFRNLEDNHVVVRKDGLAEIVIDGHGHSVGYTLPGSSGVFQLP
jgi:hypothetical protein